MTEANDETVCRPLAREGVFTCLDPGESEAARALSRGTLGRVQGGLSDVGPTDRETWRRLANEACAVWGAGAGERVELSCMYVPRLLPEATERDIEAIMARGYDRATAEYVVGLADPMLFDETAWDAAQAKLWAEVRAMASATSRPRREPRGKRRRSRQVRSTRARARRRVEAREQRRAS